MTTHVMRLVANEHMGGEFRRPTWLQNYEPSTRDGKGLVTGTCIRANAMRGTVAELAALWKAQSTTMPLRPDGLPNRPLSAFTVLFEEAGDE